MQADVHINFHFYCTVFLLHFLLLYITFDKFATKCLNTGGVIIDMKNVFYFGFILLFLHMSTGRSSDLPILGILGKLSLSQI